MSRWRCSVSFAGAVPKPFLIHCEEIAQAESLLIHCEEKGQAWSLRVPCCRHEVGQASNSYLGPFQRVPPSWLQESAEKAAWARRPSALFSILAAAG